MDVMAGYAANPNIYGTVVVSLGCETARWIWWSRPFRERTNKPIKEVIIQEVGGTLKAVDMGVRYAKEMVAEASMLQKEEFPISRADHRHGVRRLRSYQRSGCQPRHRRDERPHRSRRRHLHSL